MGRQFDGSDLVPPLWIGLILASLSVSGNSPFIRLTFIISNSAGVTVSAVIF